MKKTIGIAIAGTVIGMAMVLTSHAGTTDSTVCPTGQGNVAVADADASGTTYECVVVTTPTNNKCPSGQVLVTAAVASVSMSADGKTPVTNLIDKQECVAGSMVTANGTCPSGTQFVGNGSCVTTPTREPSPTFNPPPPSPLPTSNPTPTATQIMSTLTASGYSQAQIDAALKEGGYSKTPAASGGSSCSLIR